MCFGESIYCLQKLSIKGIVIPRLDRGIQSFHKALDCPVKPDNDKGIDFA
jgi:hypothetical protein